LAKERVTDEKMYKARAKRTKFHLTLDRRCDVIIEVGSRHLFGNGKTRGKNKRKKANWMLIN
jgi:hypothetical protein